MKKTNKLISILLSIAMLLSLAPVTTFAALEVASGEFGASGSNLTWSLDIDGVLTVSGNGAMEDFANAASMPWYNQKSNVKTVVIESGVTSIGKDAFYGLSSLVNATISDTVTSIGNRAFSNSALTNFEFSDAGNLKTIGNSAFNSTKIKDMVIPDGVTTLGSYVFGYGPIKSVIIPASVTSVGNYVFEETSSLNEVIFLGNKEPETIGDTVFLACSSLSYVSVPADYEGDTFSNMKVVKAAPSVAAVNGKGFATLADAINAAQSINGAELMLLSHISIDSGITIESGKFTIDLNGKELFSNGYYVLRVDGADVTIVDSAGGGVFNATNDQGNIVLDVLSGSANISGGTFNSSGYPATVKDGTLKLTGKDFVLNGNWRIGWYGGSIDLSACTADEVRIQACADGLQASAVTLPDGWGLFKTNGTPCTEFVKNDIYVAKAGFKVTASVNPAEGGTVEGAGTYGSGATVNLTASASNGYRFVNWIENGEEVSTSAVYTFTSSGNRELTANFEIVPHTHSFTYSASGDTITAVCENTDGNCTDTNGGTLTIFAPANLYADGTAKEATVENNLVDTSVAIGDITYSAPYGLPPKDAGTYTASVTLGGATATVEFTLLNYAAKVTDKDGNAVGTYKTFADAITAAQGSEGSTLTLLDDITLTETARISSGKFILDLNGKTILNKTDDVLLVYYHANITIKDSCEGGTVETGGDYCYGISNLAELTVESGTIKGNGSGISNHGTLTVNGGNFEAYTYGAITNKATAKIYGGVFEGIDRGEGVQNDGDGEIYIYGGKISGDTALLNTGTAYISGGEFISSDYAALNILKGTVEVTGGSFTGTDFSDGYFSGTPYGEWTIDIDEGATLILKGGEFPNGFVIDETTANTFLAEDYYYKDADGKLIDVADDATIINGYVKVSKGADLADAVITLDETQFTYSGMEHKPTVIVTVGGKTLTEGKDYTLTFANNVNAGTATVTIKAIGQAAGGIAGGGENIGNSSNSGDITESVYTGEVTKEFTINKKPVTVTATAPDKVYDGTKDIDYDTIVITFDGIVEGDTVGYTIKEAWFNGIVVGTDWPVPIVYNVTGEDANNYTFPAGGEYIAPDYFVEATADINAKDISDSLIILGEALTYNGKEQTQTVEKVIPTGTAPEATYTVSGNKATNVGIYLLTVTGTGNFTGDAKIAYEIALDDECISHLDRVEDNGVMKWNVKSTDRESLEYVIDQLNNVVTDIADDDTKNEWADTKEACEDMLRIINSIELAIADVEEDYAGFSEDTVKSSDIPALDEIVSKVNEIKDRYGFNLTDEEKQLLEDILDGVEKLREKITETEEKLEEIKDIENNFNPENVSSDDKAAIEDKIDEIEAVNPDNLTDEQREEYEEIKAGFEALLEEIAAAEKDVADIGTELEMFDEKRVTIFWEDDIEALKAKIDELLTDENMGETEKAKLNEYKAQAEKLIEIINDPCEYFSLRFFYLLWDCLTWKWDGLNRIFEVLFGFMYAQ
ncbi:MAG: leucine-rich repeat protein [Clostridia bacterium]|nr:leucine-rich repeat protein [Clostridia bacterium]